MRSSRKQLNYGSEPVQSRCAAAWAQSIGMLFGITAWNNNLQNNLNEQDAAAAVLQVYLNDNFRIGYAYDFSVSSLASYQNGTHEISVSITFPNKRQRVVSPRYF